MENWIGLRTFAVLAVLALAAAVPLRREILRERAERSVEICLSYQETADILKHDPESLPGFLERCRVMGATSVALREETLRDWVEQGRAAFLSRAEFEKFKALGMSASDLPRPASLWCQDEKSAEAVRSALLARYPDYRDKLKPRKTGGYYFWDRPEGLWEKDLDLRLGPNPEALKLLQQIGLSPVFSFEEQGRAGLPEDTRFGQAPGPEAAAWLFTGIPESAFRKARMAPEFQDVLRRSASALILLENVNVPAVHRLAADLDLGGRVVKGHTVPVEEMRTMPPAAVAQRLARAVSERSVRFLYIHMNPDAAPLDNINGLRAALQAVKSRGYAFAPVRPRSGSFDADEKNSIVVSTPMRAPRAIAAFVLAVLGPWFAAKLALDFLKRPELQGTLPMRAWLASGAAAALSGVAIRLLLPDVEFTNGLDAFRGVKAAMALPLILIGGLLFTSDEALRFLKRKAAVRDVLLFAFAAGALIFMLRRSGNFSGGVHPLELAFRSGIEDLLGVRPRFKEFAIGHPLLILGIALWSNYRSLSKVCLWAGAVAWISIVNTFCHLHTPAAVSLLRTAHGLWLGALIGLVLAGLFKKMEKRSGFQKFLSVFAHDN